jgi:3-phosphoshikimate 1-carboxyvinyltransferase
VQPAEIETFSDHRVAMAFAVTGLRVPGITILNPLCCRKTFENYFDLLDHIQKSAKGAKR